jgi:hypothetical protein
VVEELPAEPIDEGYGKQLDSEDRHHEAAAIHERIVLV